MKESVFIAIWTEHPIYENYHEVNDNHKKTIIPLVLMMNRWDGKIGFIGGTVDANETLIDALTRELKEEAGYILEDNINLQFVCSHNTINTKTNLFSLFVSFEKFKEILMKQYTAEHFISEGSLFSVQFINYSHCKSFDNFMKNNFAITVKEEIFNLIEHLNWKEKYCL